MIFSSIAFTDLTLNSGCDELFPGVEDIDAQSTLQLRAALDAFEEGVFEFDHRVARGIDAYTGSQTEAGAKGRGSRRTRREQAYANRIPEDRQFFRPVAMQCAEWAAFKPHMWLRGRQAATTDFHPHPHSHHATPVTLGASAAAGAGSGGGSNAAAGMKPAGPFSVAAPTVAVAPAATSPWASGADGADLCVYGIKMQLARPPAGAQAVEEVLASHGSLEETFAVQHDEWEAHVSPHLRQRRGRPRDEKAVAIGLPPVEPRNAVLYDVAETLLPVVWHHLVPLLAPLLTRLAAERLDRPPTSRTASSAFRGGIGGGGARFDGGGGGGGGEFEIITFSSEGEEEAFRGDGLLGGNDAFVLERGPDGRWPGGDAAASYSGLYDDYNGDDEGGGGGGDVRDGDYGHFSRERHIGQGRRDLLYSGDGGSGSGGGNYFESDSYDSDAELYGFGISRRRDAGVEEPPPARSRLCAAGPAADGIGPATAGGSAVLTPPPGPPPILARDHPPPDGAKAPAAIGAAGSGLAPPLAPLQRSAAPPMTAVAVTAVAARSPLASPTGAAHPHAQGRALWRGTSYNGEASPSTLLPPVVPPSPSHAPVAQGSSPGPPLPLPLQQLPLQPPPPPPHQQQQQQVARRMASLGRQGGAGVVACGVTQGAGGALEVSGGMVPGTGGGSPGAGGGGGGRGPSGSHMGAGGGSTSGTRTAF